MIIRMHRHHLINVPTFVSFLICLKILTMLILSLKKFNFAFCLHFATLFPCSLPIAYQVLFLLGSNLSQSATLCQNCSCISHLTKVGHSLKSCLSHSLSFFILICVKLNFPNQFVSSTLVRCGSCSCYSTTFQSFLPTTTFLCAMQSHPHVFKCAISCSLHFLEPCDCQIRLCLISKSISYPKFMFLHVFSLLTSNLSSKFWYQPILSKINQPIKLSKTLSMCISNEVRQHHFHADCVPFLAAWHLPAMTFPSSTVSCSMSVFKQSSNWSNNAARAT
mmetsp:Transcript_5236/g.7960  ORF Transcript_5236/g.7960 Transcript_5236/m.7960 type:complete len:277 (+) Transcript_5236:2230-3060(+)